MATIVTNLTCELTGAVQVKVLQGNLFSADNAGNTINVFVTNHGQPATLGGTISANVIRGDGTTVAVSGAIDGNRAYIILPQACYAVPGVIQIIIKNTESSTVTTIAAVVANVYESTTDTVVDPGAIIPSVASLVQAIEDAVAEIPAGYNACFAPAYSTSSTYALGQYVTYSGYLYRCTTAITSSESWTAAHWTQVALANDVSALKSAFEERTLFKDTEFYEEIFPLRTGSAVTSLGRYGSVSNCVSGYSSDKCPFVYAGTKITANEGYKFSYALWDIPVSSSAAISHRLEMSLNNAAGTTITLTHDGYLAFSCAYADTSELPEDKTYYEFANEAVTVELIIRTAHSEIIEINKKIGTVFENGVYEKSENPNDFKWVPGYRVSPIGTAYSINQSTYTGIGTKGGKNIVHVYPGTTFSAKTGYILDYSVVADGSVKQLKRNVSAGTVVTIEYEGDLRLSVSNGTASTDTDSQAAAVAKAGLNINLLLKPLNDAVADAVADADAEIAKINDNGLTALFSAQQFIARDWHFGFLNISQSMGLGSNHLIPGTAKTWSSSGTKDLVQKDVWMSDGVHPFKGAGVTDMIGRTISEQLAMIPPSYRDGVGETSPSVWVGRKFLWMGTSIPASSDPDAGEGTGAKYPTLVAQQLGATVTNIAKGSSCVRINASTGEYTGMMYSHFLRSLSRTVAECDAIAADWANIYEKIANAPSTLSAEALQTMKNHSFENLLVPYLDGTNEMPDLFVIDHGHNDVRPLGIDGKNDLWINPSASLITDGILADDTYMTASNYANLKTALGNDLSGIEDVGAFAATLNRNCFKGAVNFIITVILKYNPYARIVIVSDYN